MPRRSAKPDIGTSTSEAYSVTKSFLDHDFVTTQTSAVGTFVGPAVGPGRHAAGMGTDGWAWREPPDLR